MAKRRAGIFRVALRGRAPMIQVLKDFGMSWSEVAAHFTGDVGLGGASARHFSSEWSRLNRTGPVARAEEVEQLRRDLLTRGSGGTRGWWVREE